MRTPAPPYPNASHGIALVGFMGAGKTTVGRIVADRTGLPFVDLDERIEREHGPIPSLLAHDEQAFRALERRAVLQIDSPCVLATGGGAYPQVRTRAALERRFRTVWLDVPEALARSRVPSDGSRPLLSRAGLFEARLPHYRCASARVDASPGPEAVADAVLAAIRTDVEPVQDYGVHFVDDLTAAVADLDEPIVIADATVWGLHADRLPAGLRVYTFPAGTKTVATWLELQDRILDDGVHRGQTVVAFGGGVAGDLAGFCASTLLRGLPWRLIPTTTLAMVDSAVGGKTGVDHPRGKNLIGAFHRPSGVWIDPCVLGTLPEGERIAGLAEAVKAGAVWDAQLFSLFESFARVEREVLDDDLLLHVLRLSVRAKAAVVTADEHERGLRRILNAGHTVGHGLEAALGVGTLRHGEAVAIGLCAETAFGEREGVVHPGTTERLRHALAGIGLPVVPPPFDREAALRAMALDKKASRDRVSVPLVVSPGHTSDYDLRKVRLNELLPA